MIQIKLIERENIIYLVQELEDFEKDKAMKSGLKGALNVFRVAGRRNLKQRMSSPMGVRENLLYSFSTRVKRTKIGGLAGFASPGGNHSHLVDLGTKERFYYTKQHHRKKSVGKILGKNSRFKLGFWSDAKVSEEKKAVDALYKGVERAVQRINDRRK